MDPQLFGKLLELLQLISRKVDLSLEVNRREMRERTYQLELDMRRSIHSIGGARARFNETGMIDLLNERYLEDEAVKTEYRELRNRIDVLSEEITLLVLEATG